MAFWSFNPAVKMSGVNYSWRECFASVRCVDGTKHQVAGFRDVDPTCWYAYVRLQEPREMGLSVVSELIPNRGIIAKITPRADYGWQLDGDFVDLDGKLFTGCDGIEEKLVRGVTSFLANAYSNLPSDLNGLAGNVSLGSHPIGTRVSRKYDSGGPPRFKNVVPNRGKRKGHKTVFNCL